MPFKSNKQRRYLWANEPRIAREWTDRYGARGGGIMRIPLANGSLRGHPLYGTERPEWFNKQYDFQGTKISSPAEREAINQINTGYLPYMEQRSTAQIPYNTGEFDWIDTGEGADIFPRTELGSDLSNQMYKDAFGWGAEPDKIKANGLTPEELTASLSDDAINVTEGKYITTTPDNYKRIPHNYYEKSYNTAARAPVFDINKTGDPALNPLSKNVQYKDPYGTVSEAEANNPNFKYLDQLKKDFKDAKQSLGASKDAFLEDINPIKKTLATILPGGDPGYVKGGLYNKIFKGLGSAKEYGETKLKNIGSTIGKPVLGLASMIGKMVDKFDKLPMADQMYISQQMGGAGQMGEGIYRDPQSGALRDKGGLNVRSARGNYAEAVYKEANRYDKAIKRAEEKYGVKWDGTQFVNANTNEVDKNSELATKRNKRNLEMFHYYNNKKIKQKKFVSNYLQSPKVQKQKADEIIAKEKAKKTGHAEAQATGGDYHGGQKSTVDGQTTDWGPMSHMIARGGLAQRAPRGSYFNGGLASLWRR